MKPVVSLQTGLEQGLTSKKWNNTHLWSKGGAWILKDLSLEAAAAIREVGGAVMGSAHLRSESNQSLAD